MLATMIGFGAIMVIFAARISSAGYITVGVVLSHYPLLKTLTATSGEWRLDRMTTEPGLDRIWGPEASTA
jgi:hypothetical protein